jgi:hypothetical protein
VELNLETRNKIAEILKAENNREAYLEELGKIVEIDSSAGSARTARTRYLAAKAALVLAERRYDAFAAVKLEKPFEVNLRKKRDLMKTATQRFNQLVDYEIGEITAAATFYLAEIYAHFSKALMTSERPEGLSPLELEQYDLAIEEQAYPFEEKAIEVHENNLKLISRGVYNVWVEKSLRRLAEFVPARYAKPEETTGIVGSLETYVFVMNRPAAPAASDIHEGARAADGESAAPVREREPESVSESGSGAPAQVQTPGSVIEVEPGEPAQIEGPGAVETGTASRRGEDDGVVPDAEVK